MKHCSWVENLSKYPWNFEGENIHVYAVWTVPLGIVIFSCESIVDVWPFVRIKVTAHSCHGEEGVGTICGTKVLQEPRNVQSEVPRPGEVVWVCVHPANYLEGARKSKRERVKDWRILCQSKGSPLKTSKPSKLKQIIPSRPQLPFACLSEATWRQLCFSALSNPCTIFWLMVSIWGSHTLRLSSIEPKLWMVRGQSLPHYEVYFTFEGTGKHFQKYGNECP